MRQSESSPAASREILDRARCDSNSPEVVSSTLRPNHNARDHQKQPETAETGGLTRTTKLVQANHFRNAISLLGDF